MSGLPHPPHPQNGDNWFLDSVRQPSDPSDPSDIVPEVEPVGSLPTILTIATVASIVLNIAATYLTNWDRGLFYESGLYFVAIPGALAAATATIQPTSGPGTVFRNATITILATALVVREGFICVLMALPLILPVVGLVAWSRRGKGRKVARFAVVPALLVGMSGDGVVYELPTTAVGAESRIIDVPIEDFEDSLAATADLPAIKPLLFHLPFPKPTSAIATGSDVGDTTTVAFDSGGELVFEVVSSSPSRLEWAVVQNTTPVANWMTLNTVTVEWGQVSAGTAVHVSINFDRELSPAFYFDPLERWGVGEMAEVLADMLEHNAIEAS